MTGSKAQARWQQLFAAVSAVAPPISQQFETDAKATFAALVSTLPTTVQAAVAAREHKSLPGLRNVVPPQWCLVDVAEGEFPRVCRYDSVAKLAAAIATAEGRATALVAFVGVPLPFSKLQVTDDGKLFRYLHLPDDTSVTTATTAEEQKLLERLELPTGIEIEEHGWVGDMEYHDASSFYSTASPPSGFVGADDMLDGDADDVDNESIDDDDAPEKF